MNEQLVISVPNSSAAAPRFWKRHALEIMVGIFVVVMSFAYGLSVGLAKHRSNAWADLAETFDLSLETAPLRRIKLPDGVKAVPLGREVTINNQPAEMVSFVSNRPAKELVDQQMQSWKAAGMKTVGTSTSQRGFVIAFDQANSERYSFSAWTVPPAMRPSMSGGAPVSGMIAVADARSATAASDGTVPDVPLMAGGKAGAVFSALDPGGRSYTGVYTIPATLEESANFYRSELSGAGWSELNSEISTIEGAKFEVGNVIFHRGPEQIVLLFSPSRDVRAADSGSEKTVVSVTRGPFNIEQWRAPR